MSRIKLVIGNDILFILKKPVFKIFAGIFLLPFTSTFFAQGEPGELVKGIIIKNTSSNGVGNIQVGVYIVSIRRLIRVKSPNRIYTETIDKLK